MSLNFKSIGRRLAAEVADLYEFGPRFMLHHVARAMRREVLVVPVQGGTMEARPGNSDIQTISQVFGRRDLFSANLDWLDEVTVTIIEPHDWRFPGRGTSRKFQQAFGIRPFELYLKGENIIYVRL
jgi:hypothetical protein